MAGLLVAMLAIKGRVTHQLSAADRHLRAVAVADALLSGWWADPPTFPIDRSGRVAADATLAWRTTRQPDADPTAARMGVRTVRVQVTDAATGAVLAGVDVLLPAAEPLRK